MTVSALNVFVEKLGKKAKFHKVISIESLKTSNEWEHRIRLWYWADAGGI